MFKNTRIVVETRFEFRWRCWSNRTVNKHVRECLLRVLDLLVRCCYRRQIRKAFHNDVFTILENYALIKTMKKNSSEQKNTEHECLN